MVGPWVGAINPTIGLSKYVRGKAGIFYPISVLEFCSLCTIQKIRGCATSYITLTYIGMKFPFIYA